MGLFKKNPDPITGRSRELSAQIAALESKIKKLNQAVQAGMEPQETPRKGNSQGGDLIFERVDQNQLKAPVEPPATPQHFNDLGVRKYDLLSLLDRIKKQFRAPPAANPKLVSYLASGSIQGLRPLRYEKRVSRNRFIALLVIFLLAALGIISYALEHRH